MGKSNPPPPPDPRETAAAQTANNIGTAIANTNLGNINQYTPYGSLEYVPRPVKPNVPEVVQTPDGKFKVGDRVFNRAKPANYHRDQLLAEATKVPEITTSTSGTTTPRTWNAEKGSFEGGESTQQTSYHVGDQTFGSRAEAQAYVDQQNPQFQTYRYVDPNDGSVYEIPLYDAIQTLTPEQERLLKTQQGAQQNLAEFAETQSGRVNDLLSKPMTLNGLPSGGFADPKQTQQFMDERNNNRIKEIERAGGLSGDFGNVQGNVRGQNFQTQFGDAGDITRTYGTDFEESRRRVEDALFSRINPSLDRDKESLRASLINQGIREGSEAFDRAMNRFGEQSNDARMQAVLAGGQEQSRLANLEAQRAGFENAAQQQAYNQAMGRGQFANDARGQQFGADLSRGQFANNAQQQRFGQGLSRQQLTNNAAQQNNAAQFQLAGWNTSLTNQNEASLAALRGEQDADRSTALQERFAMRNQPLNEIGALLGTGQVQNPTFVNPNTATIPTVDRAGLEMQAYNQQLAAWQQQNAQKQGLLGGILGAGGQLGAAAITSDRRLKRDIRRIGQFGRLPIYEFRYTDERLGKGVQTGFMADDVAQIAPDAVAPFAGGFMGVDYVKAMEAA